MNKMANAGSVTAGSEYIQDAANSTIASQPGREMQSEPREAALQHVEHVVAWQQA